jgi:hypothetical protein
MASWRARRARLLAEEVPVGVLSAACGRTRVRVWDCVPAGIDAFGASVATERIEYRARRRRPARPSISAVGKSVRDPTEGPSRWEPRGRNGEPNLEAPTTKCGNSRQKSGPNREDDNL